MIRSSRIKKSIHSFLVPEASEVVIAEAEAGDVTEELGPGAINSCCILHQSWIVFGKQTEPSVSTVCAA